MVDEAQSSVQEELQNLTRNLALATPLYLLVPILYALLPRIWEGQIILAWVALGAIGWLIALLLRLPLLTLFRNLKLSTDSRQRATILASGPTEELTRIIVLAIAGRDIDTAYSLGLGWASIEVVYALINGFTIASLLRRTDEQAMKARQQLEEMGLLRQSINPLWGVSERISATGLHIGFTLLLAFRPILILFTIPIHSGVNYGLVTLMRRQVSIVAIQLLLLLIGLSAFILGIFALIYNKPATIAQ